MRLKSLLLNIAKNNHKISKVHLNFMQMTLIEFKLVRGAYMTFGIVFSMGMVFMDIL